MNPSCPNNFIDKSKLINLFVEIVGGCRRNVETFENDLWDKRLLQPSYPPTLG